MIDESEMPCWTVHSLCRCRQSLLAEAEAAPRAVAKCGLAALASERPICVHRLADAPRAFSCGYDVASCLCTIFLIWHIPLGTSFLYHIGMAATVRDLLLRTYQACVRQEPKETMWHCGIDQIHFSTMKRERPEMFLKIGDG